MYLDLGSLLSDSQAITATAASTNIIDLGAVGKTAYNSVQLKRSVGSSSSERVPFVIKVDASFNNLTSLKFDFQTDEDSAFGSPKVVFSATLLLADLVKGKVVMDQLPFEVKERYLRVYYTVVGTAPTLGTVTAGCVTSVDATYKG